MWTLLLREGCTTSPTWTVWANQRYTPTQCTAVVQTCSYGNALGVAGGAGAGSRGWSEPCDQDGEGSGERPVH